MWGQPSSAVRRSESSACARPLGCVPWIEIRIN